MDARPASLGNVQPSLARLFHPPAPLPVCSLLPRLYPGLPSPSCSHVCAHLPSLSRQRAALACLPDPLPGSVPVLVVASLPWAHVVTFISDLNTVKAAGGHSWVIAAGARPRRRRHPQEY